MNTRNLRRRETPVAKPPSVVDRIVDTIKDGILLGRYAPGQRLVENDFIAESGFSRPTLREALRRLEAEGVVLLERNRGAVVRHFSREDIAEAYDVRGLLETHAARLAARRVAAGTESPAPLEAARRRMRKRLEKSQSEYVRENTRFHVLVAEMSGNAWLRRIVDTLQLPIDRLAIFHFVTAGASRSSLREHEAIIDAIVAGDEAAAEKAMRSHLRSSRKMVEALPDRAFR